MNENTEIRIVLEEDELGYAQAAARKWKVDLEIVAEPQVIEPVTAILVAGGALLVGKFVVDLIDRLRGGVLIDLRPDAKDFIKRRRGVPYGWALIRSADGKEVKIETHDAPKDAAERLLGQIIEGVLKSATEIAKVAREALGDDKVQEQPEAA